MYVPSILCVTIEKAYFPYISATVIKFNSIALRGIPFDNLGGLGFSVLLSRPFFLAYKQSNFFAKRRNLTNISADAKKSKIVCPSRGALNVILSVSLKVLTQRKYRTYSSMV